MRKEGNGGSSIVQRRPSRRADPEAASTPHTLLRSAAVQDSGCASGMMRAVTPLLTPPYKSAAGTSSSSPLLPDLALSGLLLPLPSPWHCSTLSHNATG
ncbi:hypothetical protein BRADI_2g35418v3 [Brachypodium distachyon]|uniref:Uncharacterized protein n=1 Tax=Brachypodium distachyon TaxID=15368 RepID=A0A0Q3G7U0_BRADI|nr:hypothetical protein BRADI_2g35418v3 [Brachypodium distachyon]